MSDPFKLHIGGRIRKDGWKILDIDDRPGVDYCGSCVSLKQFQDNSVDEIYASHVYEHLSFRNELPQALQEACRVLKPGGSLKISVPDMDVLCKIYLAELEDNEQRHWVQTMMFGGQMDDYDYHKSGLNWDILIKYLREAGFSSARRLKTFDLFDDASNFMCSGIPISLNVEAFK